MGIIGEITGSHPVWFKTTDRQYKPDPIFTEISPINLNIDNTDSTSQKRDFNCHRIFSRTMIYSLLFNGKGMPPKYRGKADRVKRTTDTDD